MSQIHISNYSEMTNDFVRYIFQQRFAVSNTYNFVCAINHTDINVASISIGETTYPFQIVVFPTLLTF